MQQFVSSWIISIQKSNRLFVLNAIFRDMGKQFFDASYASCRLYLSNIVRLVGTIIHVSVFPL